MSSSTVVEATRADVCVAAVADAFRGDGEIIGSPMGTTPTIGARLARATFEPDLMLSDGVSQFFEGTARVGARPDEFATVGWIPYRQVLDILASGRRHVMMGPVQIDPYGNANISCIGDWAKPKRQVLGSRGGPGNTINHATSYWVPKHSARVFTPKVDMVSCVGYDRAATLGAAGRFHEVRHVITNLCVLEFTDPGDGVKKMTLKSLHPGVTVDEVVAATGFELIIPAEVPVTRTPDAAELQLISEVIDPRGMRLREVPA